MKRLARFRALARQADRWSRDAIALVGVGCIALGLSKRVGGAGLDCGRRVCGPARPIRDIDALPLLPALTPDEYQALRDEIARRGVAVPVELGESGTILDGHAVLFPDAAQDWGRQHESAALLAGLSDGLRDLVGGDRRGRARRAAEGSPGLHLDTLRATARIQAPARAPTRWIWPAPPRSRLSATPSGPSRSLSRDCAGAGQAPRASPVPGKLTRLGANHERPRPATWYLCPISEALCSE